MFRLRHFFVLVACALPFLPWQICDAQDKPTGASVKTELESPSAPESSATVARIGQRTGGKATILRPALIDKETLAKMKTVPGDGMIVAIGGHNSMSTDRLLANLALQRVAGGELDVQKDMFALPKKQLSALQQKVRVLVLKQSSGDDEKQNRRSSRVMFDTAGIPAGNVTVLGDEVTESVPLDGYHLVYLGGGNQNAFRAMLSDKVIKDLHEYLNHGGMIGGTSAGAAILCERMFAGGREPQDGTLTPDVVELRDGFGFFQALSIDMHLFQYVRFARALGALAVLNNERARELAAEHVTVVKENESPVDNIILSLGQDSIAVFQALDLTGEMRDKDKPVKATGAVKVTIAGTTQSWLYQCGPNFVSDLTKLPRANDLADEWDVHLSVVSPGAWFVMKW